MSSNAARLAAAVRARREELELSQLDVWQGGGPSNTTLTEIENGRTASLTRTTARKLDAALQWEPGSAKAVWSGGQPAPVGATQIPPDVLEDLAKVRPESRAYILERLGLDEPATKDRKRGEVG